VAGREVTVPVNSTAEVVLAARWPGVAFEVPPAIIVASWDDPPRDIAGDLRAVRDAMSRAGDGRYGFGAPGG
jgi:hypothetical protein